MSIKADKQLVEYIQMCRSIKSAKNNWHSICKSSICQINQNYLRSKYKCVCPKLTTIICVVHVTLSVHQSVFFLNFFINLSCKVLHTCIHYLLWQNRIVFKDIKWFQDNIIILFVDILENTFKNNSSISIFCLKTIDWYCIKTSSTSSSS